jgi:hypothetical protein
VVRLFFEIVFWASAVIFVAFVGALFTVLIRDRLRFRAIRRANDQANAKRMDRLARDAFDRESAEVTELERIARL